MKQKTLLVISAALTAFVLVIVGTVIVTAKSVNQAMAAPAPAQPTATEMVAAPTSDVTQELLAREAAYQKLIDEANQRLQQAEQEKAALQAQLQAAQNANNASSSATTTTTFSPQDAAQVAASYLGRSDLYSVEAVQSNGFPLYKVTFSSGDIVLVSMDGQVVAAQLAPSAPSSSGGRLQSGGEHENHEEHEGEHD